MSHGTLTVHAGRLVVHDVLDGIADGAQDLPACGALTLGAQAARASGLADNVVQTTVAGIDRAIHSLVLMESNAMVFCP